MSLGTARGRSQEDVWEKESPRPPRSQPREEARTPEGNLSSKEEALASGRLRRAGEEPLAWPWTQGPEAAGGPADVPA